MAPRDPYKVHSLKKHIADSQKSQNGTTPQRARAAAAAAKKAAGPSGAIFNNNSDDDDSSSNENGSDSSDEEGGSNFLRNLGAANKTSASAPKRRSKDEEIADSDVERQESTKKATSNPAKSESDSESSSEDDSSSEDESEPAPAAKTSKANANIKTEDSSSEEESEDESEDQGPAATQKKLKRESSESESSSDEDSEDEDESSSKPAPKAAQNGAASKESTSSSSEESSSEEDEPSSAPTPKAQKPESEAESSSSEDEDEDGQAVDESMHISDREDSQQVTIPNMIAPDFMLRKSLAGANGKDVAEICSQANLQGKQVWYFTVPSNVPVSVVQNLEIPLDQSQRGDHVFSHNGENYGVSFDSMTPKSTIQILIPSSDGLQYQSAPRQVDQIMQVRRITQLGGSSGDQSNVGPAPKPAARPQPEGLRTRFKPIGVYDAPIVSTTHAEDTEMADAPASQELPTEKTEKKAKKEKSKKKDKAAPETITGLDAVTPAKKRKHTASEDDALAAAAQLREESQSTDTGVKKRRKDRDGSPDLGFEHQVGGSRQTPVLPPTIPSSLPTIDSSQMAATPTPKPSKKGKKAKSTEVPVPSSSIEPQGVSTPAPSRKSHVPLPSIPGSSQPKNSPVPIPQPGASVSTPVSTKSDKTKKAKSGKSKSKDSAGPSQAKGQTPVPPPVVKGMS
uniref:DNA-directed RNA polymerase I subunit RPA34.5 n=1 Tax=Bionectria ochroleuca TaxID=29856 RepID=A0A8H7TTJ1_BIOOC